MSTEETQIAPQQTLQIEVGDEPATLAGPQVEPAATEPVVETTVQAEQADEGPVKPAAQPEAPPAPAADAPRITDARQTMADQIAAELQAEREALEAEGGEGEQTETQPEPVAQADGGQEPTGTAPEAPAQAEPESPLVQGADGSTLMKLKVDGQDVLMPIDQAVAELQKGQAADARLNAAQQAQTQAQALLAQAQAQAQAQPAAPPEAPAAPEPEPEVDFDDAAEAVIKEIIEGDEKAAVEKLAQALRQGRGASPATAPSAEATDQRVAQIAAQVAAEKIALDQQYQTFAQEYPEIVSDQQAFDIADLMATQVEAESPHFTPLQVMREAGNRVRAFKGQPAAQAQPAQPAPTGTPKVVDMTQRIQRKANLQPMPGTGGSAAEEIAQRAPKPKTTEEIVQEMRESRLGKTAIL